MLADTFATYHLPITPSCSCTCLRSCGYAKQEIQLPGFCGACGTQLALFLLSEDSGVLRQVCFHARRVMLHARPSQDGSRADSTVLDRHHIHASYWRFRQSLASDGKMPGYYGFAHLPRRTAAPAPGTLPLSV